MQPKPSSFLKHASDVASFYGFRPARDIERIAGNRLEKRVGAQSFDSVAALASICATLRPEPVLAYWATPSPAFAPKTLPVREVGEFGLQVVGTRESVGEVVLLKTVAAIIGEWGAPIKRVRVNALGDKDSRQRFEREALAFARKHEPRFEEACRQSRDLSLYTCGHDTCRAVLAEGPRPMSFLSERSRAHFRSVLEHLENLGLPYELDDLLVSDRDAQISFATDSAEDATIVASVGGRYDDFLRRLTGRKDASGVGASIFFRKKGLVKSNFTAPRGGKAPQIYFVQLGLRAKLQGLVVVDMLREARIPVSQSFDATHLAPQLISARELGVAYTLIMGQREALDGTIIVRSMQNSSQQVVPVQSLPRFLKTLRK